MTATGALDETTGSSHEDADVLVVTTTVAERATRRPRGCTVCDRPATGFVTVTRRRGERRSGPVCAGGECRAQIVHQMTVELTGWPARSSRRAEPERTHAQPAAATHAARVIEPQWMPAGDEQLAAVRAWWSKLDLEGVAAAAMSHLDMCSEAARLAPSSHQAADWAVTRILSVAGLGPNVPDDPDEATMRMLCWDLAEDWAHSVAARWQDLTAQEREAAAAETRGRCAGGLSVDL